MSNISNWLAAMRASGGVVDQPRTRYGVRLVAPAVWASPNRRWSTDTAHALRFDFCTSAFEYAVMSLDLSLEQFTVEAL